MNTSQPTITTVAEFPLHTMPENLAVRADGSILVVASPQRQLWYVPAPSGTLPVEPVLLETFDEEQLAQSLVEVEPDLFLVTTYGDAVLRRLDLRGWTPGEPVSTTTVFRFDPPAGPNGAALVGPGVMLLADCVEGLIWRLDVTDDARTVAASVWLKDESMAAGGGHPDVKFSDTQSVPFPGINGLAFGPKTQHVYWATSSLGVFARVAIDPDSYEPTGPVEKLADVVNCDDLCLDEDLGVAYIARHPDHIIERAPLDPNRPAPDQRPAAGDPFTDALIGPTSIDWGRSPGDYGRVAYAPTDGGVIKLPADGQLRPARLVRIEFSSAHQDTL